MRVLADRLRAVLEPDPAPRARSARRAAGGPGGAGAAGGPGAGGAGGPGAGASADVRVGAPPLAAATPPVPGLGGLGSGAGSARASASGLPRPPPLGAAIRGADTARAAGPPGAAGTPGAPPPSPAASAGGGAAAPAGGDGEDLSAFDLLHTERGFGAFDQWYRRGLAGGSSARTAHEPKASLGSLWPQVFVPPNALHEHAFLDLLRIFADCSEGEAMDMFDLLDCDCLGVLSMPQVYMGMCLVAALGSQQLTKFLYFHSAAFFGMLAGGCRLSAAPERVTWPKIVCLLRLAGTPGCIISKLCVDFGLTSRTQLCYDDFMEVAWAAFAQLDRGADAGEVTVINEGDRPLGAVKSRLCSVL